MDPRASILPLSLSKQMREAKKIAPCGIGGNLSCAGKVYTHKRCEQYIMNEYKESGGSKNSHGSKLVIMGYCMN